MKLYFSDNYGYLEIDFYTIRKNGIHILMDNNTIVGISKERQTELLEILSADS